MNTTEDIKILKHITIVTKEVYTDGLKSRMQEYSQHLKTSRNTIIGDIVSCLDVCSDGKSEEVTIKIKFRHNQPELITKTWTLSKERY